MTLDIIFVLEEYEKATSPQGGGKSYLMHR